MKRLAVITASVAAWFFSSAQMVVCPGRQGPLPPRLGRLWTRHTVFRRIGKGLLRRTQHRTEDRTRLRLRCGLEAHGGRASRFSVCRLRRTCPCARERRSQGQDDRRGLQQEWPRSSLSGGFGDQQAGRLRRQARRRRRRRDSDVDVSGLPARQRSRPCNGQDRQRRCTGSQPGAPRQAIRWNAGIQFQ